MDKFKALHRGQSKRQKLGLILKKRRLINPDDFTQSSFISLYVVIKIKRVNFYINSTLKTGNILIFRSSVATAASASTFVEATFVEATSAATATSAAATIATATTAATTCTAATETTAAT